MAGLPDGAALEGLGRFRQQRPHFRHFIGPDEMNVGIYGIGAVAAGGIAVRCLKRKKKKI